MFSIEDITDAYRKAKFDIFQFSAPDGKKIIKFERDLARRSGTLLNLVNSKDLDWAKSRDITGDWTVIPQGIQNVEGPNGQGRHDSRLFSHGSRGKRSIFEPNDGHLPEVNFRLYLDATVEFHILSSLWMQEVGIKIDKALGGDVYSNRIRKLKNQKYNKYSMGSFLPYVGGYASWKDEAIRAAENLVKEDKEATVIRFDIKSFFHKIVPSDAFSVELIQRVTGETLDERGARINSILKKASQAWSERIAQKFNIKEGHVGLPVGLSASAVLGNAVLYDFDKEVRREVRPRYYGRYCDDILLIMEGHPDLNSEELIWQWLDQRITNMRRIGREDGDGKDTRQTKKKIDILLSCGTDRWCQLSPEKSEIRSFSGTYGSSVIRSIRKVAQKNTSEYRLPSFGDNPDETGSMRVFSAINEDGEESDSLHRTTGIAATRRKIARMVANLETYTNYVDSGSWRNEREEVYHSVNDHIRHGKILFDAASYVERIIAVAMANKDLDQVLSIVSSIGEILEELDASAATVSLKAFGEDDIQGSWQDKSMRRMLLLRWRRSIVESLVDALESNGDVIRSKDRENVLRSIDDQIGYRRVYTNFHNMSPFSHKDYFAADLARRPFRELFAPSGFREETSPDPIMRDIASHVRLVPSEFIRGYLANGIKSLGERLDEGQNIRSTLCANLSSDIPGWKDKNEREQAQSVWCMTGLLFPTRPIPVSEIFSWTSAFDSPNEPKVKRQTVNDWLTVTRGFTTDSWSVPESLSGQGTDETNDQDSILHFPADGMANPKQRSVCIVSYEVPESSIRSSIHGKPNHSYRRFHAFRKLLTDCISSAETPPDYIVLPEVSVPGRWFTFAARSLAYRGISLISGIEYFKNFRDEFVNEVWSSLPNTLLGFPTSAIVRTKKGIAAYGEQRNLTQIDNRILDTDTQGRGVTVIDHDGFCFSILICFELTDIFMRSRLRGKIDALIVPEWNRDISTYNSLVEAAASDLHCFVVQVNNRLYGDSRIRAPYSDKWKRDVARVRGGTNDHFLMGTIEIESLRKFQTDASPTNARFKPLPAFYRDDVIERRKKI